MAGSPRVVAADVTFTWDRVPWRLHRGQVIDVPPGSALEKAIGANMLVPLGATGPAAQPPAPDAEEAPREEPEAAPAKSRAAVKTQDAGSSDDKEETA